MMSANHLAPDLAAEIYVLDGPPSHRAGSPQPLDRDHPLRNGNLTHASN
jgi:hypothetical protein